MRARLSHAVFAATLIAFGVAGLAKGSFTQLWQPVPKYVPAQGVLAYVCAAVGLGCGLGLLWRRAAPVAARVLLAALAAWFLLVRAPYILVQPSIGAWWSDCKAAVMLAAAWVVYVAVATDEDRRRLAFATGARGLRVARLLYGLALIPFGIAHFLYMGNTAPLVPGWLGWPVFWGYATGVTFVAAGVAIVAGVQARLAAALSALQMGLFLVLVWIPIWAAGNLKPGQWSELVVTWALAVAGWVVADSYRGASSMGTDAP